MSSFTWGLVNSRVYMHKLECTENSLTLCLLYFSLCPIGLLRFMVKNAWNHLKKMKQESELTK